MLRKKGKGKENKWKEIGTYTVAASSVSYNTILNINNIVFSSRMLRVLQSLKEGNKNI